MITRRQALQLLAAAPAGAAVPRSYFRGEPLRIGKLQTGPDVTKLPQSASFIHAEFEAYVSLAGLIDVAAEVKRLEKQLAEKRKHLQGTEAKLNNASFVDKAPKEVVQQQHDLVTELQGQIKVMEANLGELQAG